MVLIWNFSIFGSIKTMMKNNLGQYKKLSINIVIQKRSILKKRLVLRDLEFVKPKKSPW